MNNQWHTKTILEVIEALITSERGLSKEEARRRLKEYGLNKLPEGKVDSLAVIFFRQFQSPLIYVLLAATIIIFAISEVIDGLVILTVLLFNAVIGAIQEGRAQNTLRALKKFAETQATVRRDGQELIVPDSEVVPGDVIVLQEGEKIPADARLFFVNSLKIDEASLTGESGAISKTEASLPVDHLPAEASAQAGLPVVDQKNMVFKGTHVLSGLGLAVVVTTGSATAIGKIAREIAVMDTEIPLKKDIRYLSRLIIATVALISLLLLIIGLLVGRPIRELLATVVALAVSVIPEGLPIVLTLVLATGLWRMSKRQALVKKLQAVEALGQTKVIAVDKTGTLTRNEMVVQRVYTGGKLFTITGSGYEPTGEALLANQVIDPLNHPELILSGKIMAWSASAHLSFLEAAGVWKVAGDPTEAAMLVFAEKIGFRREALAAEAPKIFEFPFDYQKKYHAVIREVEGKNWLVLAGAPEKVLELCQTVWHEERANQLTKEKREELEAVLSSLAQDGFRVVAYAINTQAERSFNPAAPPPLTFVGFLGIKDALRPEVQAAVRQVKAANLRIVMITGDHALTAESIAKEAGIWQAGDLILTGAEMEQMSDAELAIKLSKTTVFARVTPEHKLRIIQAYRQSGEVVAMTGDGVNDAPSLVAADLGVAMGKIGTEVAKEAADIVLLDDNFGSIVAAVEEGRSIYRTIKKVILYLFSTNLGEVLTIAGAIALGYALPILPAQIIWLNFVTDGFLDVALAMEPKEAGLLKSTFERPKKYLVDKLMAQRMLLMALPMAVGTLYLFQGSLAVDLTKAWTISLTTLAVFQWFNAWNCRSEDKSIFQMNLLTNKFLIAATVLVIALQLAALYLPPLQKVLRTEPLTMAQWLMIIPVAASVIFVEEIRKFFHRRYRGRLNSEVGLH